jgi:hypothetical protein
LDNPKKLWTTSPQWNHGWHLTTLLLVGLRTDWLRRKDALKTAGRKTKATNVVASRAHGTEGQNNPAPWGGLDGKKNSGHRKSVFSLTSFMELIRS